MKIAWKYIDKRTATVAAIRDYTNMRAVINNTPDEIKELYDQMSAPRTTNISGMPTTHNPLAGQNSLAGQLDKLDILRDRYSSAIEYMSWFEPAWGTLTDKEQRILTEYYMSDCFRNGARIRLADEFNYTERHIDRLCVKALQRLRALLFG